MAETIKRSLEAAGKKCYIAAESLDDPFYRHTNAQLIPDDVECAIVLGGDGTMLHASHDLCLRKIPVFGINMGTFGFLAQTEVSGIGKAIKTLAEDDHKIEERLMLSADISCKGQKVSALAVNDVVITKGSRTRVISLGVYVNDDLVGEYFGDGVIVSSPTGSTGYSLSAGGPIVTPEAELMLITPICPHTLNARCIIVAATDRVTIKVQNMGNNKNPDADAVVDGYRSYGLVPGDVITVKRAGTNSRMIRLGDRSFFDVLHGKLEGKE